MPNGRPMKLLGEKGPNRPKGVRHPQAFHAFRNGKPEAEELLMETCRDPESQPLPEPEPCLPSSVHERSQFRRSQKEFGC